MKLPTNPLTPCNPVWYKKQLVLMTNVTGTPITVVDTCVVVKHLLMCLLFKVLRTALLVSPVPTTWFPNLVLLTLPMHGVLTLALVTAPNTNESAEVNFTAAGTTVITCVITSVTATDSPVTVTLSVTGCVLFLLTTACNAYHLWSLVLLLAVTDGITTLL